MPGLMSDIHFSNYRERPLGEDTLRELCGIHWGSAFKGEMKNDHGERTNRKIKDQPFYQRGSGGKMRKW